MESEENKSCLYYDIFKTSWTQCDCRNNIHFSSGSITAEAALYFLTYQHGDKETLKKLSITVFSFYCPHFLECSQRWNQTAQKPSQQSSCPEPSICLQSIGGWEQWVHKASHSRSLLRAFWIFGVFLSSSPLAPPSPSFSLAAATFLWMLVMLFTEQENWIKKSTEVECTCSILLQIPTLWIRSKLQFCLYRYFLGIL